MGIERPQNPPNEGVAVRFAMVRKLKGYTQATIGATLGLSQDQVTNIEVGRTALKFAHGWEFCRVCVTNQLWLATGAGRAFPFLPIDLPSDASRGDREFSRVCMSFPVRGLLEQAENILSATPGPALSLPEQLAQTLSNKVLERHNRLLFELSELALENLLGQLRDPNKVLPNVAALGNVAEMKSPLASLLVRLNELTRSHGKKSELAQFLGVPLTSVSRWLSGEREPGGETTLRMLQWVEQQERE